MNNLIGQSHVDGISISNFNFSNYGVVHFNNKLFDAGQFHHLFYANGRPCSLRRHTSLRILILTIKIE